MNKQFNTRRHFIPNTSANNTKVAANDRSFHLKSPNTKCVMTARLLSNCGTQYHYGSDLESQSNVLSTLQQILLALPCPVLQSVKYADDESIR